MVLLVFPEKHLIRNGPILGGPTKRADEDFFTPLRMEKHTHTVAHVFNGADLIIGERDGEFVVLIG